MPHFLELVSCSKHLPVVACHPRCNCKLHETDWRCRFICAATLKTQLENKGDNGHYADLFNIVIWVPTPVAFGLTAWLMHYHGQGFTLAVCQTVCMAFLGMQVGVSWNDFIKSNDFTPLGLGFQSFHLFISLLACRSVSRLAIMRNTHLAHVNC